MKKSFFSFGIVCISLLIVSCTSSKKVLNVTTLNGEWDIVEVEGMKVTESTQQHAPYIGFDFEAKRIYGNSGCNRMMGTFSADTLKPGMINFGAIAGTRMACPDMQMEQNVLNALGNVRTFQGIDCVNPDNRPCRIALCDENGKQLIIIEKRDNMEESTNWSALKGEWKIKSVNGEAITLKDMDENEKDVFIGFNIDENRVYGNAGCNSINGGLKQSDGKANSLEFVQVASTMMLCLDLNMEVERKVLNTLDVVRSYNMLADGNLALYDANGTEVMILEKK